MQGTDNDSKIISEETRELEEITSINDSRKKDIILRAALKLESKYLDHSVICVKLQKEWKDINISKNYIRDTLPQKYKREYRESQPPTKDEITEFLESLAGAMKSMGNVLNSLAKKAISDEPLREYISDYMRHYHNFHENTEAIYHELQKQITEISDIKDLLRFGHQLESDAGAIMKLLDSRQKFGTAIKFSLKLIFVYKSYEEVAGKIGDKKYGAKWLSTIDTDPELNKLITNIGKCPVCKWNFTTWLEKAMLAQRKGLQIPKIPTK